MHRSSESKLAQTKLGAVVNYHCQQTKLGAVVNTTASATARPANSPLPAAQQMPVQKLLATAVCQHHSVAANLCRRITDVIKDSAVRLQLPIPMCLRGTILAGACLRCSQCIVKIRDHERRVSAIEGQGNTIQGVLGASTSTRTLGASGTIHDGSNILLGASTSTKLLGVSSRNVDDACLRTCSVEATAMSKAGLSVRTGVGNLLVQGALRAEAP